MDKRKYKIKKVVKKPDYAEYLQSGAWKAKRLQRFKIDGFSCQMCGTTGLLNAHHLTYKRLGHENMEDLITLCEDCHKKIHAMRGAERAAADNALRFLAKKLDS